MPLKLSQQQWLNIAIHISRNFFLGFRFKEKQTEKKFFSREV